MRFLEHEVGNIRMHGTKTHAEENEDIVVEMTHVTKNIGTSSQKKKKEHWNINHLVHIKKATIPPCTDLGIKS